MKISPSRQTYITQTQFKNNYMNSGNKINFTGQKALDPDKIIGRAKKRNLIKQGADIVDVKFEDIKFENKVKSHMTDIEAFKRRLDEVMHRINTLKERNEKDLEYLNKIVAIFDKKK